jgi:AcrR family transcriptional regulator
VTPRPDVSAERREQILDTAEGVFARRGFHETRMDDIVAESGLSKGAIYWYFKKKDDLIGALMDRVFRRSIDAMRRAAAHDGCAAEVLQRIGEQISRDYQMISHLMPIALEFYATALRQRSVRKRLASMYEELVDILVPIIETGIRRGELRDVDARTAATLIVSAYEGLGLVWSISPKSVVWKSLGPAAVSMIVKGLEKR